MVSACDPIGYGHPRDHGDWLKGASRIVGHRRAEPERRGRKRGRAGAGRSHEELAAVGKGDVAAVGAVGTILGLIAIDDDDLAGLDGVALQAALAGNNGVCEPTGEYMRYPSDRFGMLQRVQCARKTQREAVPTILQSKSQDSCDDSGKVSETPGTS
jgi:hypothetical protein